MIEIERKFLVNSSRFKEFSVSRQQIAQGYLCSHPERTVRIRIMGESGYITIKGKGNTSGTTRFEWETEVPLLEARPLFELCEPGAIQKIRYRVPAGKHIFEVDEFLAENQGLILAEIELSDEAETFEHPDWLGDEVTGDDRYYNAYLCRHPFTAWPRP